VRSWDLDLKVYLLPYSGGSSFYYSKWNDSSIDFCPIEYKGHGMRMGEEWYKSIFEAAEDIAGYIENECDCEYAIFGHSLGALITYEVYRKLLIDGFTLPKHIFMSGCRAPHCKVNVKISELNFEEYKEAVINLGGISNDFFLNKKIFNTFNPILYHDFEINEQYVLRSKDRINNTFYIFVGDEDKSITDEDINAWSDYGDYELYKFHGNHFYLNENTEKVISIIKQKMCQ